MAEKRRGPSGATNATLPSLRYENERCRYSVVAATARIGREQRGRRSACGIAPVHVHPVSRSRRGSNVSFRRPPAKSGATYQCKIRRRFPGATSSTRGSKCAPVTITAPMLSWRETGRLCLEQSCNLNHSGGHAPAPPPPHPPTPTTPPPPPPLRRRAPVEPFSSWLSDDCP